MSDTPTIGVCYYPEHWPEAQWQDDARRMAELGITYVRIGEFAWSRLEPARGELRLDWLERSIETLRAAGLKVVLGTPTATPPKWLVDEIPDMLPVDREGRVRGFGSRRHYSFSHQGYREECLRIVRVLGERFGENPAVVAWQIDNEYGCHSTTRDWSNASLLAFRVWLKNKYSSIDELNEAWGNVFWSEEYPSFDSIELPAVAPTVYNPAHQLDFYRFSSDQVVSFNRLQAELVRKLSPGRDIIHNFMGRTLDFDHYKVGADLDVSSWDCYPLGFLEDRSNAGDEWKRRFMRAGDPDFQAFHHDLYRATSSGRWWVMELQPGPVNWAGYNPAPRDGMVRLWSLEAIAHGAETVSYFRWRQAPFAQEQMHAGLLRSNGADAEAYREAEAAFADISRIDAAPRTQADVAVIFDYESEWAWETLPHGHDFDYFRLVFDHYRALRRKGLSIDILPPDADDLSGYSAVVIPGLFAWSDQLTAALRAYEGVALVGPRSGSKTENFAIPAKLPPNLPQDIAVLSIGRVESLRPDMPVPMAEDAGNFHLWREFVEPGPSCETVLESRDGVPALVRQNRLFYLGGWPDDALMDHVIGRVCAEAGLTTLDLPDGVRLRRRGDLTFAMNYGDTEESLDDLGVTGTFVVGDPVLPPSGVSVLRR